MRVIECYDFFVQMESLTGQLRELQRLYTETCNKLTTATNEIETIPKLQQDNLSLKMQNKNLEEKIQVRYCMSVKIVYCFTFSQLTHVIQLLNAVAMAIKERNLEKRNSTRQLPSSKYEFNHNNVLIKCMPKTILTIDTDQI